eukprot:tig00021127_g18748.t1
MRRVDSKAILGQQPPNFTISDEARGPTISEVTFLVRVETQPTDSVIVVGDCLPLGVWQPSQGLVLRTTPETYPVWRGTAQLPPNLPVQYKYVVRGSAEIRWEVLAANRALNPTAGVIIQDDGNFGSMGSGPGNRGATTPINLTERSKLATHPHHADLARQATFSLPRSTTVIVVLYRLPVIPSRAEDGTWSFRWDDDALYLTSQGLKRSMQGKTRLLWVGWPSCYVPPDEHERVAKQLLDEHSCVPVFLEKESVDDHYHGFCKSQMWLLFHNILDTSGSTTKEFDRRLWQAYSAVNNRFAQSIIEVYNEGDMIWVHDYHLLLLPTLIRRRLHAAKIGIFLHTPFPSSEVLRTLPIREDILRGMLSASLVGFHLFDFARHFLSCCVRMLGLQFESRRGGFLGVEYNGRHVMVRVSHVGIDPDRFIQRLEVPAVRESAHQMAARYRGRTVLLGIDDMDKLKGIPLKLMAFKQLLTSYPQLRGRVHLVQIGLPKNARHEEQAALREEIRALIGEIDAAFATGTYRPVEFSERALTFDERVALYSVADVVVNTSIRDGLNLVPYEYIVCSGDRSGTLVVSEFTGCGRGLAAASIVNPWNTEEVATAIHRSLSASPIDRQVKHDKDYEYVTRHTTQTWADSFLADLEAAAEKADKSTYMSLGLGTGFRVLEFGTGFKKADFDEIVRSYRRSKRRLIVLDYEGTLVPGGRETARQAPSEAVLNGLKALCNDPHNTVFIVAGRERKILERWFGSVPKLGLAAEHGIYYRYGPEAPEGWRLSVPSLDQSWMEAALDLLQSYTERTDGAYIEAKECALVWHFRDADPDFGAMQAKELHDHLDNVLGAFPVQVVNGKGIVEVKPRMCNKGSTVERILGDLAEQSRSMGIPCVDFVLVIGDDRSDEEMFNALENYAESPGCNWGLHLGRTRSTSSAGGSPQHTPASPAFGAMPAPALPPPALGGPAASGLDSPALGVPGSGYPSLSGHPHPSELASFSITIGRKPSHAKYFLDNYEETNELLSALARNRSSSSRGSFSSFDAAHNLSNLA